MSSRGRKVIAPSSSGLFRVFTQSDFDAEKKRLLDCTRAVDPDVRHLELELLECHGIAFSSPSVRYETGGYKKPHLWTEAYLDFVEKDLWNTWYDKDVSEYRRLLKAVHEHVYGKCRPNGPCGCL